MRDRVVFALAVVTLFAACAATPSGGIDGSTSVDGGSVDASAPGDAAIAPYGCDGAISTCIAYDTRSFCQPSSTGGTTQTEVCPQGCSQGACSTTACSDECVLGGAPTAQGTCGLWSLVSQSFVSPDLTTLHDRARDYEDHLRNFALPEGEVMNPYFSDTTYSTVSSYAGSTDSAIWTGTALAGESWRYLVTGEPDALAALTAMVGTLHRGFNISPGDVGYLARVAISSALTTPLAALGENGPATFAPCSTAGLAAGWHCGITYAADGKSYDWLGQTSRDAFTGAMLGYATAYRALAGVDEPLRDEIRKDVVTIVKQLMLTQTVHATVAIQSSLPTVSVKKTITLENVILAPSEMTDGQVMITIDTSNPSDATMIGLREFLPDYSTAVSQILGTSPPIPVSSSAMMLGGFFTMALSMTDGVAGYESDRQAISTYYEAHVQGWIAIAKQWSFATSCGGGYFANHIALIMMYEWALLEADPTRQATLREDVLANTMWAALKGQKNSYFAFLWGGTQAAPDAVDVMTAVSQFEEFPAAPRLVPPMNLESDPQYLPHDPTCGDDFCTTSDNAVDVGQRRVQDFMWQRDPWELSDPGVPLLEYPGVDYLAAYWLGRYDGFLVEDTPGACTRYQN